jgi:hypothetical protein
MRFVVEPLPTPSVVRPSHEPGVVYVRVAAPLDDRIAVLPEPAALVSAAIAQARAEGRRLDRGVVVGADHFFDAAAEHAPGRNDALAALVEVFACFQKEGVPFVWRTRAGLPAQAPLPPVIANALVAAHGLAMVEVGVPTLDVELTAALEGHGGAAPHERLRLATALASRGVGVRGLVDPLVPMLTDQQQALEELVVAFAEAGVARLGTRYMLLTPERARAVAGRLTGMQRALIQGVFLDEPWRKPDPESASAAGGAVREVHKKIPGHLRRSGHHRLLEAGARHGVVVDILDPVEEGEDLSDVRAEKAEKAHAEEKQPQPARVRRRPQLELFRKSK